MTMRRSIAVVLMLLGSLALGLAGIAQQSATEAPAGFDTPTLAQNPGSRSISNGIEEPPGDTSLSISRSTNRPTTSTADWALCSTREHVPSVIKTQSVAAPVSLPSCARDTGTPPAIS